MNLLSAFRSTKTCSSPHTAFFNCSKNLKISPYILTDSGVIMMFAGHSVLYPSLREASASDAAVATDEDDDADCAFSIFSSISKPTLPESGSVCANVEAITLFSTIRFSVAGLRATAECARPVVAFVHVASSFTSLKREVERCWANSPSWKSR
jgi:hypothetical protein